MRTLIALLAALAALSSAPADADVYKWADKNGRIHYSDQLPEGARVLAIQDRLSLYSPEPAVALALQAAPRRNATAALADRVAALERQLQSERLARQPAGASDARAAYERCLADGRTDCAQMSGGAASAPVAGANRPAAAAPGAIARSASRAS